MRWSHSAYPSEPTRRAVYRFMEMPYTGRSEVLKRMGFTERVPHHSSELAGYFKRQRRWFVFKRKPDFQKMGYYSWLWKASRWGAPETAW